MRYLAVVALLVGLLSSSVLASSQVWVKLPPASWSASQVEAFLNDSPWAGKAFVQRLVHTLAYPKHKAVVTWESATLVRQARTRAAHFAADADAGGVPTYSVSVRIWGTAMALDSFAGYPQFYPQVAALKRSGKAAVTPIRVEEFLVDKGGKVVAPIPIRDRMDGDGVVTHDACGHFRGRAPAPGSLAGVFNSASVAVGSADRIGNSYLVRDDLPCKTSRVLIYHFPATDPITASEQVEFTARVGPQTVTRTFVMSQMVVNGNLDLR